MKKNGINRREMLGSIAALGATATLGLTQVKTAALNMATPPLTQAEMTAVDTAMGKKGKYVEAENTYTVPLPRNDLKVTVKGEAVPISFGFGGWVSVKKTMDGKSAVLMSDTVLLEEEVNPLISAAHANGLEISAIHNHFFYEQPRIFYMHLHGMGTVADLAKSYLIHLFLRRTPTAWRLARFTIISFTSNRAFFICTCTEWERSPI